MEHRLDPKVCAPAVGTGAAWGDYDNDGDEDLYCSNFAGHHRLFRNNGNGTFTDVAQQAAVHELPSYGAGANFVDFDNDGDKDLFVLALGPNVLYENKGDGTFSVVPRSGLGDPMRGMTAAWGDYDNDGLLDVYVANHMLCMEKDTPSRDRLYHNNGDGTFSDVTDLLNNMGPETNGYAFAVGWLDYDSDDDLDLYVVNDYVRREPFVQKSHPHVLWRNDGADGADGWRFTDVSRPTGVDLKQNGMCLAIGDYNNDNHLDMFVTNVGKTALLHNNGDGTYRERSARAGIIRLFRDVTWGAAFVDFDNDCWQDLHMVGGFIEVEYVGKRQPDYLYWNRHNGRFLNISRVSGIRGRPGTFDDQGRTSAYADYDGDGFVDIFVVNYGRDARLYRNISGDRGNRCHWCAVELKGTISNADGVGAKVRLTAGGLTQLRQIRCGTSIGSGDSLTAHFGLGEAAQIDRLEITWPSGLVQTVEDVNVDTKIVVTEDPLDGILGATRKKVQTAAARVEQATRPLMSRILPWLR